MHEIDLIPTDYRNRIWLQGRARAIGGMLVSVVLGLLLALAALHLLAGRAEVRITALQARQAITAQQREQLAQLDASRAELESRLALLDGLRSGAAAPAMFAAVDRALVEGDVWFRGWEFNRAGSMVQRKQEPGSNGYFIVIPAAGENAGQEAWKIETHMKIRGQAKDHAALSGFVRRLYQQPEIADVRILNTTVASGSRFVDFNLAVTVNSHGTS
ncbi:MAG: PilN domain-containing protein [Pseudomonadota bacterium]